MKKIGFPVKLFLLVSLFTVYGIFKISNAIAALSHDARRSMNEQHLIVKTRSYTGLPVVSVSKNSETWLKFKMIRVATDLVLLGCYR